MTLQNLTKKNNLIDDKHFYDAKRRRRRTKDQMASRFAFPANYVIGRWLLKRSPPENFQVNRWPQYSLQSPEVSASSDTPSSRTFRQVDS